LHLYVNHRLGDFTYYLLTPADRKESASMAVFRQSRLSTFALLRPPYRRLAEALTKFLTR